MRLECDLRIIWLLTNYKSMDPHGKCRCNLSLRPTALRSGPKQSVSILPFELAKTCPRCREIRVPCGHGLMVIPEPQRSAELPPTFFCHLFPGSVRKPNKLRRTNKEPGDEGAPENIENSWSKCRILGRCIKRHKALSTWLQAPAIAVKLATEIFAQICESLKNPGTNAMGFLIVYSAEHLRDSRHITASKGPKSGRHRIHKWRSQTLERPRLLSAPCMSEPRLCLNPIATTLDCCESGSTSCCLQHSRT